MGNNLSTIHIAEDWAIVSIGFLNANVKQVLVPPQIHDEGYMGDYDLGMLVRAGKCQKVLKGFQIGSIESTDLGV